MSIQKIIQRVNKSQNVLISTHVNADTDAVCSELVVAEFLKSKGKKVSIINDEKASGMLSFLPGVKTIKGYKKGMNVKFDLVIIVDAGDLARIGKTRCLIKDEDVINIDHHATNTFFGKFNFVDEKASSATEAIYDVLVADKFRMTDKAAMYIYSGIMTDTGSFRYENTSAKTHRVVSELMEYKFSAYKLYQKIYETISLKDMKLFSKLTTQFEAKRSGKLLVLELTKKILNQFSDNFDLRDAIFRYLRSIKGVEVIAIFTEDAKNVTRANLRSMNSVNVAKLANKFVGGGHKRASGCTIKSSLKEARHKMLKEIGKVL